MPVYMIIFLFLSACSPPKELRWRHIKSPLSGRCYEIATSGFATTYGIMGMSEIPCREAKLEEGAK